MIWSTLLLSTLISMAQREIYTHLPGLCRRIIVRQAAKLPARLRSRHEEEWLAHSAQLQGSLRQFFHASSIWIDRAAASITRDDVFEGLAEVGDDLKGLIYSTKSC